MTDTIKLPDAPPLVTVTVDGAEMKLPKGKNLLQALLDAGHYVPHYCYHPSLSIAGNCRLCLIEIEGRPKPEISCNMTCADGLKIKTNSDLVDDCRKGMMEFLLVNHPLDCPICDRGGECMLQRYSMDYGWGTARTSDFRRRFQKPQFDPLIDIERNRCIMCTRCVRFCDEVGGDHVMGVFGHGNGNYIGTFGNGPVSNMFSGNVIDLCPVGCLTSKPFRFQARAWELRQVLTTTRHCNGVVTAWTRGGKLLRVTPPPRLRNGLWTIDEDTTRFISNEARFGSKYALSTERILHPLVRKDGRLVRASWGVALDAAAAALRAGGAKTCVLAGERSSNEECFLLSRMASESLGGAAIDWRSRFVGEAAANAAGAALAASDGDFDLMDHKAYGATLLVNGDFLGSAPDIALRLREAARLGRTKLALLGARIDRWTASHAQTAYLEQPEELAGVMEKLAAALAKGRDAANAPEGFESLFELLIDNGQGLLVLGLDNSGGALNAALVPAAFALLKALGPGWQFIGATAARNARGAVASGAQAGQATGGPAGDIKSQSAPALLRRAAMGEFQTLFLHRADELVTHVQRDLIEKAIKSTPNVIVTDLFPSWITELASVVLPGALFFESDGSMTDIDGTLQRMALGAKPAGDAQEDWRILESLRELLGSPRRFRAALEIFAELGTIWGAPGPLDLHNLHLNGPGETAPQVHHSPAFERRRAVQFKIKSPQREDKPQAAELTTSPKAPKSAKSVKPAKAAALAGDQVRLLWIHHAHGSDHLGSRSTVYDALRPQPRIELSPEDAQRLGLREDDWVVIVDGADAPSQVTINPYLAAGVAFGAANVLGLRLSEDAATNELPLIRLKKTEAPEPTAAKTETVHA